MKEFQPQEISILGSRGLDILTVTNWRFTVNGAVSYKDFPADYGGRIFYCDGRSFPAGCVYEVLMG